jgi:hypothetical protein
VKRIPGVVPLEGVEDVDGESEVVLEKKYRYIKYPSTATKARLGMEMVASSSAGDDIVGDGNCDGPSNNTLVVRDGRLCRWLRTGRV